MGQGSGDTGPGPPLLPADGDQEPHEQPDDSQQFPERWGRALSPSEQSRELADDLDKLARHAVDLTDRFLPVLFIALGVAISLVVLLLAVGMGADILTWFGLIKLRSSPITIFRLVSPAGLLVTMGIRRALRSPRSSRNRRGRKGRHRRRRLATVITLSVGFAGITT